MKVAAHPLSSAEDYCLTSSVLLYFVAQLVYSLNVMVLG